MDLELSKQLQRIENELKHIHSSVHEPWLKLVLRALLRGAAFVMGTALGIFIAGWLLNSIFGVIPVLSDIANTLQGILESQSRF